MCRASFYGQKRASSSLVKQLYRHIRGLLLAMRLHADKYRKRQVDQGNISCEVWRIKELPRGPASHQGDVGKRHSLRRYLRLRSPDGDRAGLWRQPYRHNELQDR